MPDFVIKVEGEPVTLTHENTMIYLFPTRPEMNHVYANLDRSVAMRDVPVLINALIGCGFPICSQVFPRQSEIDSYAEYLLDGLDSDLEGLNDDETP